MSRGILHEKVSRKVEIKPVTEYHARQTMEALFILVSASILASCGPPPPNPLLGQWVVYKAQVGNRIEQEIPKDDQTYAESP